MSSTPRCFDLPANILRRGSGFDRRKYSLLFRVPRNAGLHKLELYLCFSHFDMMFLFGEIFYFLDIFTTTLGEVRCSLILHAEYL